MGHLHSTKTSSRRSRLRRVASYLVAQFDAIWCNSALVQQAVRGRGTPRSHALSQRTWDSFVLWRVGGYHGTKAFGPTTAKSTWRWTRAERHAFPSSGSSAAPTGRRRAKCKSGATMRRSEEFPCHRRCVAQSPNLSRSQTRRHRSSNSHFVKTNGATISTCNAGGWAKQHL